ncbi:unnamed protein product, partial [Lymnaea stagnalis]
MKLTLSAVIFAVHGILSLAYSTKTGSDQMNGVEQANVGFKSERYKVVRISQKHSTHDPVLPLKQGFPPKRTDNNRKHLRSNISFQKGRRRRSADQTPDASRRHPRGEIGLRIFDGGHTGVIRHDTPESVNGAVNTGIPNTVRKTQPAAHGGRENIPDSGTLVSSPQFKDVVETKPKHFSAARMGPRGGQNSHESPKLRQARSVYSGRKENAHPISEHLPRSKRRIPASTSSPRASKHAARVEMYTVSTGDSVPSDIPTTAPDFIQRGSGFQRGSPGMTNVTSTMPPRGSAISRPEQSQMLADKTHGQKYGPMHDTDIANSGSQIDASPGVAKGNAGGKSSELNNKGNNRPSTADNKGKNKPPSADNKGNNKPSSADNKGNNKPSSADNKGNNKPLSADNKGNNEGRNPSTKDIDSIVTEVRSRERDSDKQVRRAGDKPATERPMNGETDYERGWHDWLVGDDEGLSKESSDSGPPSSGVYATVNKLVLLVGELQDQRGRDRERIAHLENLFRRQNDSFQEILSELSEVRRKTGHIETALNVVVGQFKGDISAIKTNQKQYWKQVVIARKHRIKDQALAVKLAYNWSQEVIGAKKENEEKLSQFSVHMKAKHENVTGSLSALTSALDQIANKTNIISGFLSSNVTKLVKDVKEMERGVTALTSRVNELVTAPVKLIAKSRPREQTVSGNLRSGYASHRRAQQARVNSTQAVSGSDIKHQGFPSNEASDNNEISSPEISGPNIRAAGHSDERPPIPTIFPSRSSEQGDEVARATPNEAQVIGTIVKDEHATEAMSSDSQGKSDRLPSLGHNEATWSRERNNHFVAAESWPEMLQADRYLVEEATSPAVTIAQHVHVTDFQTDYTNNLTTDQTHHLTTDQTNHLSTDQTITLTTDQTNHLTTDQTNHLTTDQTNHLSTDQTNHLSTDQTNHLTTDQTNHLTTDQTQTNHLTRDQTNNLTTDQTNHLTTDQTNHLRTDQTNQATTYVTGYETTYVTTPYRYQNNDPSTYQTTDPSTYQTTDPSTYRTTDPST